MNTSFKRAGKNVKIYDSTDDYSGSYLNNPTIIALAEKHKKNIDS